MASIASKIKNDRNQVKASVEWLYGMVGSKIRKGNIPAEAFNPRKDKVFIGGMFVYVYDPKLKDKLPWYDTLPVVIPIDLYPDGWLGLNVHYLPPNQRILLMDKLMEFKKRSATPRAYMKLSYEFLTSVVQSKLFAPCVHRYLGNHVRSPLIRISDQYWDKVAMLPIQQFQKATASQVWGKKR